MTLLPHRYLQQTPISDFMSTLQSVQINPTELCNRTCVFCPRNDSTLYKNSNRHMTIDTCKKIGNQLSEFNFKGRVGLVGFGEPLLNPKLVDCIAALKSNCPSITWIEVNTNGDFLNRDVVESLSQAGCTDIAVSMYDQDDTDKYQEMFNNIDINYVLRHHYDKSKDYNLSLVNRIDILKKNVQEINKNSCYIPFYKMFIDWNGDFLLCDQDWGRESKKYNINNVSVANFWTSKLDRYRINLTKGNRNLQRPCSSCNVHGRLHGQASFEFIDKLLVDL